jgi:mannosyltransferase OCH1-like enzyme
MPVKYLPCATNPQRMKNSEDTQKEIPKIIYICHKNIECLDATYNFWKNLNPLYEIRLFDDALCENFLLEEFSELHQSIFKFIPDGPIKSDFWRVCIIYKYGGIYVDADIHPLVPLKEFLLHDSDFVTCMTKHNQNFNPHFIAARKNDPILKECIEEYIEFYNKRQYEYWKWSIVHVFNRKLSNVKHHYNKTPTSQVFTFDNKKYQLFLEEYDNKKKHFLKIRKTHPHDYYCSFLNERIFNTRYNNYDPCDHSFKNYIVKNRKTFFDILRLR